MLCFSWEVCCRDVGHDYYKASDWPISPMLRLSFVVIDAKASLLSCVECCKLRIVNQSVSGILWNLSRSSYSYKRDCYVVMSSCGMWCGKNFFSKRASNETYYVLNLVLPNPIQKQTKYLPYNWSLHLFNGKMLHFVILH